MLRNEDTVRCGECKRFLFEKQKLVFYETPCSGTHLILDPRNEEESVIKNLELQVNPNKRRARFCPFEVLCLACKKILGKKLKLGKDSSLLLGFGADKIYVGDFSPRATTWKQVLADNPLFNNIPIETEETLYPGGLEFIPASQREVVSVVRHSNRSEFPCAQDPSLLTDAFPREYQLECYLQSIYQNTLIVMPTGSGKTLMKSIMPPKIISMQR